MRPFIAVLLQLLCLLALAGTPGAAQADANSYESLVKSALEAYDTGRWVEARTLFKRAHERSPSARTLRGVGMCSFNLGDYVDAMLHLEAALDDLGHENARPLSADQRAHVDELVERAARKIGRFRLQVVPDDAQVSIDGRPAVRSVRGDILLEAGRHELLVSAAGHRSAQRTLSVDPGDRAALEVRLEPATQDAGSALPPSLAPAPVVAAHASAPRGEAQAPRSQAWRRFGLVTGGLGVVGLSGFAVAGSMALASKNHLDDACRGQVCPPTKHHDVDAYQRQKLVSAVGVYAGAALLSVGITALLLDRRSARAQSKEMSQLTPYFGFGIVGIRGTM